MRYEFQSHPGSAAAKVVGMRDVVQLTSVSRATVYNLIRDCGFPKPVQLGKRRIGFREAEVLAWLNSRKIAA
jgi:prophage regulatory protein